MMPRGIAFQVDGSVRYTTRAFNGICYLLAGLWIAGALITSLRITPTETISKEYHDFSQFYMGGLVAKHHAWDSLYPTPKPGSFNSPGEPDDSDMRPGYAELAREAHVPANATRYIQPPPFALLMEPTAFLKYSLAKQAWKLLMVLCAWGVAIQAGRITQRCAKRPTRLAGITALLIAVSPITLDALRILNVTPFLSLLIGFSILGLLQRYGEGGAVALVIGAASKYVTAVLLPMYIAMRRWRSIIIMAIAAAAIVVGSLAIMGTLPFKIFFHEMVPTFGRVHTEPWNRSLAALCMQVAHMPPPLHGRLHWILQIARWLCLLGILAAIFSRKQTDWQHPPTVLAGAAALLAWFLIFSPIVWDHYFMYLMPLWGWLLWEARGHWMAAILVVVVLGFENIPRWIVDSHTIDLLQDRSTIAHILIGGGMVICAAITLLLAMFRLCVPAPESAWAASSPEYHIATPKQFNRVCFCAAALWLIAIVPFSLHVRTMGHGDFTQFYMGGVMAKLHAWGDVYPIPNPGSVNNPGMPDDSAMRPRYAAERIARNVDNGPRFIQPPPMALLLLPLGYLTYPDAYFTWIILLICCGWVVGYLGGKIFESLCGGPCIGSGLLMLLIVCSPLMLHSIRVANMSVLVALLIAVAILGLLRRWDLAGGCAILLGMVSKYTPIVLLPLAVVMRRWTMILWMFIAGLVLLAATLAISGIAPFHIYIHQILPTLARPHGIETNQSIWSFATRLLHEPVLHTPAKMLILAAQGFFLTLVLWLVLRQPPVTWTDARYVYAAATTLLGTFLIFSPVFWEHYPIYFCPLWGWMLWEGWQSRFRTKLPLAVAGIALIYVPWTYLYAWREPFNTHMLVGTILMMLLGIWKLCETPAQITQSIKLERVSSDHEGTILADVQEQSCGQEAGQQTAAAEADKG